MLTSRVLIKILLQHAADTLPVLGPMTRPDSFGGG